MGDTTNTEPPVLTGLVRTKCNALSNFVEDTYPIVDNGSPA